MARSPYQSRSMTAGLLESAPMHRRRHRTRITFPSTTPVAWDQKLGLPCQEVPVLPARQGAEVPPGQRGEHMRPTHRPSWAVGETQGRARAKHSPGEPPACETQQQDPARSGAGRQRAETHPPMPSSHLPIRDGRDGSCRVSAHSWQQLLQVLSRPGHLAGQLGHHLGERGLRSGEQLGCVRVIHFTHNRTGSSVALCQQHTAPARQGRREPAPIHGPQRLRKCPPHPNARAPSSLPPADASLGSSSRVLPTARSPPAPRDVVPC